MKQVLVLALVLALAGCRCEDEPPSPPPPTPPVAKVGKPEVSGLRATIQKLSAGGPGGRLELTCVLEWYAAPTSELSADGTLFMSNVWLLEGQEPMWVRFWSPSGAELESALEQVLVPEPFRRRLSATHESQLLVAPPAGATSVSVALGNSGLETERKELP